MGDPPAQVRPPLLAVHVAEVSSVQLQHPAGPRLPKVPLERPFPGSREVKVLRELGMWQLPAERSAPLGGSPWQCLSPRAPHPQPWAGSLPPAVPVPGPLPCWLCGTLRGAIIPRPRALPRAHPSLCHMLPRTRTMSLSPQYPSVSTCHTGSASALTNNSLAGPPETVSRTPQSVHLSATHRGTHSLAHAAP